MKRKILYLAIGVHKGIKAGRRDMEDGRACDGLCCEDVAGCCKIVREEHSYMTGFFTSH